MIMFFFYYNEENNIRLARKTKEETRTSYWAVKAVNIPVETFSIDSHR